VLVSSHRYPVIGMSEWFEAVLRRFRLNVRKHFFTEWVFKHRNRLPGEVFAAPSLSAFKRHLDNVLNAL